MLGVIAKVNDTIMNETIGNEPAAGAVDGGSNWPRRRFIRHFALGTAFSLLGGRRWTATLVADCQPTITGAGILRVKVSDFPALANTNGSVRLALNPFSLTGPNGAFYPVMINRGTGTQFFSMSTQCRHQGCVVPTFSASLGAIVCACHGSRYSISGALLGGPATQPLITYTNSFDGIDLLCVQIPNLGYSVTATPLDTTAGPRLKLQFPTKSGLKYEVRFRQNVPDVGTVVPFSTTETGPASNSVLTGNNTAATAYVDRTAAAGFYSVAVQVTSG